MKIFLMIMPLIQDKAREETISNKSAAIYQIDDFMNKGFGV
jgi:hypothetical protein